MKSPELDMRLSGNDLTLTPINNGPQTTAQLTTVGHGEGKPPREDALGAID
jgi:hypothetical protein